MAEERAYKTGKGSQEGEIEGMSEGKGNSYDKAPRAGGHGTQSASELSLEW